MSNCSGGGPQVPFGDGSHVPLEETVDSVSDSTEIDMQTAMKNIFLSCDTNNDGSVIVSKLIDFIMPFMHQHIPALMELKKALDPNDCDPHIDNETFFKVMSAWTLRFSEGAPEANDSFCNSSEREFDKLTEVDLSFVESSPRASFGHHFLKGYTESGVLNLSASSSYSYAGNNATDVTDLATLQEHIKELEHQNRRLTENVEHLKGQLANSDEQNETLRENVDRISRKLHSEEQISNQLQKNRKQAEELMETSAAAQKQICKLEKQLAASEKQVVQLKQNVEKLETEKQKFEENNDRALKREGETKKLMITLEDEMSAKDQVITTLEEENSQLKTKLKEQEQVISDYTHINECLKEEKIKLEQNYRDTLKSRSLSVNPSSKSFSEFSNSNKTGNLKIPKLSNIQERLIRARENGSENSYNTPKLVTSFGKLRNQYNSPRLLNMVANPISPHLDNSVIASSLHGKKSVDSDESPVFVYGKRENVFADITSTPEGLKFTQKTLLDQTPPSAIRKLPVLSPVHEDKEYLSKKSDLAFFSHYRFVGEDSSDDENLNSASAARRSKIDTNTRINTQIQQEHNTDITNTEDQKRKPSVVSNESNKKENSLPTMYVVERTTRSNCKSASSYNDTSLSKSSSGRDTNSEDDFSWSLPIMNVSPHESLDSEISRANENECKEKQNYAFVISKQHRTIQDLKHESTEFKNTIENLVKENKRLKSQTTCNDENQKGHPSDSSVTTEHELEYKMLKTKVEDLESENNHKYIKIIDLMEEKDILQKELERVNGKNKEIISKLQLDISDAQREKEHLIQQIDQINWEKENSVAVSKHLQSIKNECDVLQIRLQRSRKTEEDLKKKFERIFKENCELRAKVEKIGGEKIEQNNKFKKLSEECTRLRQGMKIRTEEEIDLIETRDEMNSQLAKLNQENLDLHYKLSKTNAESQNNLLLEKKYKQVKEELELQVKEFKTLKDIVAEYSDEIARLKKEIAELNDTNTKLSESVIEKERQMILIKQMISYQNVDLKKVEAARDNATSKLYEQQCENEKLAEKYNELMEKNNDLFEKNAKLKEKLNCNDQEKSYLNVQLKSFEECNKSIQAELDIINYDFKQMKDNNNNMLKEYQSLLAEKEMLLRNNEKLANDYENLGTLKQKIEEQLHTLKQERDALSEQNNTLTTTMEELKSNLQSAQTEITDLMDKLDQNKEALHNTHFTKDVDIVQGKIFELEDTIRMLQCKNEQLEEDFKAIKSSYECLASEKEIWLVEKNNREKLENDFSKKLIAARTESELLQDQLNQMESCTEEKLSVNEAFCSKCIKLKIEINQLNSCIRDLQCKTPNRSYEKMQLKLEKVRTKCELSEERLYSEKEKTSKLESSNAKLQAEIEENLKHHKENKIKLLAKISLLEEKLMKINDDLQRLQEEKQEMELEKNVALKEGANLKKKFEIMKEEHWTSVNMQNSQLKQEIEDIAKQKISLEKRLERTQHLLKGKVLLERQVAAAKVKEGRLESITKENSQMKYEIDKLNSEKKDNKKKLEKLQCDLRDKSLSEQTVKSYLETVTKENNYFSQQLKQLQNQQAELEKKLERTQHDLQKSEVKNLSIRRQLTDMQSGCDDVVLKTWDCKNLDDLLKEKNNLQKQLMNCEKELTEVKIKLSDSSNKLSLLSEHVKVVNEKLGEKRQRLSRSTLTAVSNWRAVLGSTSDKKMVLEAFDKGEPANPASAFAGPLDEEMFKFKHQIHLSALFLDTLGSLRAPLLQPTQNRDVEIQVSCVDLSPPSLAQKFVKKFTLKTKPVSSRSVSPDSPSMEVEVPDIDNISPINSTGTSDVNCSISADSGVLHIIDQSDANILLHEPSANSTQMEENIVDKGVESGLFNKAPALEIASPSLSDSAMESLGLIFKEESPKWSKKDIEEKFTILVAGFMLDVSTMKERYQRQQISQSKMETNFSAEMGKLVTALKNMKELEKNYQINKTISVCLRQVQVITWLFSHASMLAMQCGALHHEQRLLKAINLMINHAANLSQVAENATRQLRSISSFKNSPRNKRSIDISTSSTDSNLQSKEISSIYQSSEADSKEPSDSNAQLGVVEQTDIPLSLLPSQLSNELKHGMQKLKEQYCFRGRDGTAGNTFVVCLLFVCIVALMVISLGSEYFCNGACVRGYPWRWVSWDDIFVPFIKRTYPHGPPPT